MPTPTIGTPTGLPANVDLRIRQGSDVTWALRYYEQTPAGVLVGNTYAGWTARYQVRRGIGAELWLTGSSPADVDLAVEDGKLKVTGRISHTVTQAAVWNSDRSLGVWDVELVRADGTVVPLASGRVFVEHDVTRDA